MGSAGALILIVVLFVGALVGWHARTARGAHADLKLNKARVPVFRRARNRSGLLSLALIVIALLIMRALIS